MRLQGEIAVAKNTHSIGEQLIMPCCKIIMSNLLSNSEVEKLKEVSLSNNTVSRRIAELFNNILSGFEDTKFKIKPFCNLA